MKGQAAQLGWMVATVALMLVLIWRQLIWMIFGAAAAAVVLFPFVASSLIGAMEGASGGFMEAAHAAHRLTIWQAYAADVATVPFWGFGANADATLGAPGSAVGQALEAAGYEGQVTSPHTVLLEWYVNFGPLGSILLAATILAGGWVVTHEPRFRAAAFTMVFASAFAASAVGTEFFQGWWIAAICYAAAVAGLIEGRRT